MSIKSFTRLLRPLPGAAYRRVLFRRPASRTGPQAGSPSQTAYFGGDMQMPPRNLERTPCRHPCGTETSHGAPVSCAIGTVEPLLTTSPLLSLDCLCGPLRRPLSGFYLRQEGLYCFHVCFMLVTMDHVSCMADAHCSSLAPQTGHFLDVLWRVDRSSFWISGDE